MKHLVTLIILYLKSFFFNYCTAFLSLPYLETQQFFAAYTVVKVLKFKHYDGIRIGSCGFLEFLEQVHEASFLAGSIMIRNMLVPTLVKKSDSLFLGSLLAGKTGS